MPITVSSISAFQCPATHEQVSSIIQEHSSNRADLRQVALEDVDLSSATRILDLGCGFGFMSEAVARHAAETAQVTGVDIWPANEPAFLERVRSTGRRARFVAMRLHDRLPWPDRSQDVIVCSFSLYFFVDILSEAARVLAPQGLLLAVTHSEESIGDLLRKTGVKKRESGLQNLIRHFSAENGEAILDRWFSDIECISYPNTLRFDMTDEEELAAYLSFKLPFLVYGRGCTDSLRKTVVQRALAHLAQTGCTQIEKDETIFRCHGPIGP